jgi:hypothetical protein
MTCFEPDAPERVSKRAGRWGDGWADERAGTMACCVVETMDYRWADKSAVM